MFLVNFSDHVSLGLPAGMPFTDQQDQLLLALSYFTAAGQTALYDGVATALDHLHLGNRDKKVLILISDGGDNASKRTRAQVMDMARHSAAIIYTIGIYDEQDADWNPAVLTRLASETGGEAFFPASSSEIPAICKGIAHDLREQYTLAYVPAIPPKDAGFRSISLKAAKEGLGHLSARTRAGYFAAREPPAPVTGASAHDIHP
jgi:VWFA-related protein